MARRKRIMANEERIDWDVDKSYKDLSSVLVRYWSSRNKKQIESF